MPETPSTPPSQPVEERIKKTEDLLRQYAGAMTLGELLDFENKMDEIRWTRGNGLSPEEMALENVIFTLRYQIRMRRSREAQERQLDRYDVFEAESARYSRQVKGYHEALSLSEQKTFMTQADRYAASETLQRLLSLVQVEPSC